MNQVDLEAACLRVCQLAKSRAAKLREFLAQQPETVPCIRHPEQVCRLSEVESARASDIDSGRLEAVYSACPVCQVEAKAEAEKTRLRAAGVPPLLLGATLDNWTARTDDDGQIIAKVRAFQERKLGSLFLIGRDSVGLGKSHLAAALCRAFIRPMFIKHSSLLYRLRQSYHDRNQETPIPRAQAAGLLVIDEIGLSAGGKDELPMMHEILDYRHNERLPTVLTGNVEIEDVREILGCRMVDRMRQSAFAVLTFKGESWRRSNRADYFGGAS